ncbi:MAG: MBL fold metallo-hydrolase [archaeon]|nr:MBL fold metallo-hydrolase [archaeon]
MQKNKNINYKLRMGVSVDFGDFIVIRPTQNYRINSGLIVIKGTEPVIIDTGTPKDTNFVRIQRAFIRHSINPDTIKYVCLTHNHQDHMLNSNILRKLCKNIKVVCNERDYHGMQHPTTLTYKWVTQLSEYMGLSKTELLFYRVLSTPIFMMFYQTINAYPQIDYTFNYRFKNGNTDINQCPKLKSGDLLLKLIPTPGHSEGHFSILDSNKNLYLGDFIPFTPWIDPSPNALTEIIQSTKTLLNLSENEVKLAVHSHGDYRKSEGNWEITPWNEEKDRFRLFLETINQSINKIPKILRNGPMNVFEITKNLIPNYSKYNVIMSRFFTPPSVTWVLNYCLSCEKKGLIKRFKIKNQIYWKL